jgi:hypothetical protein
MRKIIWKVTMGVLMLGMLVSAGHADIVKLPGSDFSSSLWDDAANVIAGKARSDSGESGVGTFELVLGVTNLGAGERYATADITWTYGHTYNFTFDYASATGATSLVIYDYDANQNKVQVASVAYTYDGTGGHTDEPNYVGQGMNVIRVNLVGAKDGDGVVISETQITHLNVNGKNFGADWGSGGTSTDRFYGNEDYAYLSEVHVTGDFLFTANDPSTKKRPRLEVQLLNYTPVPVPPSVLLLGSGLLGLAAWGCRRRKS